MNNRTEAPKAAATERGLAFVRCANCERDRLPQDVFWHRFDQAWYCTAIEACSARYERQVQRGVIEPDDPRRHLDGQDAV